MNFDEYKKKFLQWVEDLNTRINQFVADAKVYFSQLNDYEKYGWIAEGTGFVVFIVGIVLLIL